MLLTRTQVKSASIEAVKIGVDGRRTDLGLISYYHRNPLRRFLWALRRLVRRQHT